MDANYLAILSNRLEMLDAALQRAIAFEDESLTEIAHDACAIVIDEIESLPVSGNPAVLELKARAAVWCADELEDLLNADTRDVRLAAQVVAGLLDRPSTDMV